MATKTVERAAESRQSPWRTRVALVLLGTALVGCAIGEYGLVKPNGKGNAAVFYALGLAAFAALIPVAKHISGPSTSAKLASRFWLILSSAGLLLLSIRLNTQPNPPVVAGLTWLGAVGTGLAAGFPNDFSWSEWLTTMRARILAKLLTPEMGLVLVILIAGAILRLYRLDAFPSGINPDEVKYTPVALDILRGQPIGPFKIIDQNTFATYTSLEVPFIALFGNNMQALRLPGAIIAVITLPLIYVFTRRTFGVRIALISTAIVAGSGVHNAYGRRAFSDILAPLLACTAAYCLWQAQANKHRVWWVATGMVVGLTAYFYYDAQAVVGVVALYVIYLAVTRRHEWRAWTQGATLGLLGGVLTAGPALVQLISGTVHPDQLPNDFIFADWQQVVKEQSTNSVFGVLIGQVRTNLVAFFGGNGGDINDLVYYLHAPMVASILGPLLILGLTFTVTRLRDPRYALIFIWFWFYVLVPGALTVNAPRSYRLLPAIVPAACFIAIAVSWLIEVARRFPRFNLTRPLLLSMLSILVLLAGFGDQSNLFHRSVSEKPWEPATVQARFIASLGTKIRAYIMGTPNIYYSGAARFLAPQVPAVGLHNPADLPVSEPGNYGAAFLVYDVMKDDLSLLTEIYPGGRAQMVNGYNSRQFTAYSVSATEIEARRGLTASYGDMTRVEKDPANLGGGESAYPAQAEWSGSLYVATAGQYKFRAEGDSAELAIDGKQLTSADGISLWQGWHPIRLSASLSNSNTRVALKWQPPQQQLQAIPPNVLDGTVLPNTLHATIQPATGQATERWDHMIAFRDGRVYWHLQGPAEITWEGSLALDEPGRYGFGFNSDGPATLTIDERTVASDERPGRDQRTAMGNADLEVGLHPFRLDYKYRDGSGIIEALWTPPGGEQETIPRSVFRPSL